MLYMGTEDAEEFIGPEELSKTTEIIAFSKGPSGRNTEYLFNLCDALRDNDALDDATAELEAQVRARVAGA